MVPKNATKRTNATLYQNMRFWAPGPRTRFLGFRPNEYEQMTPKFFGKSLEGSGGIGKIIRPISGRSAKISTRTWWWPTSQKSKKCDFFSIFSKWVLDDHCRYQIKLPNHSKTPKMSFFRPYIDFPDNIDHFEENRIWGQKSWFLPNLMNHNMVWNLAGIGWKVQKYLKMYSPGP